MSLDNGMSVILLSTFTDFCRDVGKKMYIDVKQQIALAVETDRENMTLRQRISELDERAVAREKNRADATERKAQEQTARGDREEKRANDAENRLSDMEHFILNPYVESDRQKAANSIADMADSIVGRIGKFRWEVAVARIGQLASEMRLSTGGQSIGGSNGRSAQRDACSSKNADKLMKWDGTKKKGLGW